MASGIEVGSAYLRIIPTTDGISQGIESSLTGGTVTAAAKKSGQSIGQSLSKGLTNVGGKLTKTITAPVVAFGTASGKMAVDFESSMAKVSTLVDTNSTDMGKMQKAIINVSKQYGVSASDVAEATYQAISAGQDAGDAVDFVNQSMGLAKAGFTDASTAVDTMTTVLNAYGMSADQASHVSDALIKTQNLGKTTVDVPAADVYDRHAVSGAPGRLLEYGDHFCRVALLARTPVQYKNVHWAPYSPASIISDTR